MRIGDYEAIIQFISFLKLAQVGELLSWRQLSSIHLTVIVGYAKYDEAFVFVTLMPALEFRKSITARTAPGRPEIQQDNLTPQVREFPGCLINPLGGNNLRKRQGVPLAVPVGEFSQDSCRVQIRQTNCCSLVKIAGRQ